MFLLYRYAVARALEGFSKKKRNLCLLGLDNAGKTSFLNDIRHKFGQGSFQEVIVPTIGQNMTRIEHKKIMWTIWDVGGQKRFRDVWDNYFPEIDVLIWVVDVSNKERMDESYSELKNILANSNLAHVPLCILANKQDLQSIDANEVIKKFHLEELQDRKWTVVKSCFVGDVEKNFGTDEALQWMTEIQNDPEVSQRQEWKKDHKIETPQNHEI